MDRLIKESLESLLQESSNSKRLSKRIIALAGFLCPAEIPEGIRQQLSALSSLQIQQDAFDALLEPVTLMARSGTMQNLDSEVSRLMIASLEHTRKNISDIEDISYAELIAWLVELAQARRIIRVNSGI